MVTDARAQSSALFTVREWLLVGAVILVILVLTGIPYFYAHRIAPPETEFIGVVVNVPDHAQYFSWMRESRSLVLVPNQFTPESSTPLLFNFLWWTLGRIEALTGLSYITLYQITRLLAGAFTMAAIYVFCGVIFSSRAKRFTAFLLAVLASGFGWIWIVGKYVADLPIFPFDLYTAEPNTFYTIMGFAHFTIATGLITVIFTLVLLGQRSKNLHYAWAAAAVTLLLSLQHSYDMFTIYGVIGLYGLFLWLRDRKFPIYLFKTGLIIVLVSVWPALQAFLITTADDVWRGVLSQFDNAGAWTPNPLHLPILMGLAWLLAIWALDIKTPWRERDDTHLFIMAWFLAHFVLVYLPLNFQIHLLSGWQVITGVLATIGLYRRVLPWLEKRLKSWPRSRLVVVATAALVLLVLPANLYLYAQRFLDLNRANRIQATGSTEADEEGRREASMFFLPVETTAAMKYLESRVGTEDVVLSNLETGQFVPMLTGARSFLGHWAQTLDFFGKQAAVRAFFDGSTGDDERLETLRRYSVDYVFYGPEEARLGDYDPAGSPFLSEVFSQGAVVVYQVQADAVATR